MMEQELRDQLAGYALGVLDPVEQKQVEAQLHASSELRRELASFQEIAGLVALTADDQPVPERLKANLLARAWRDLSEAQERSTLLGRLLAPIRSAFAGRPGLALPAAAAALVIAFLGVWNLQLATTNDSLRGQIQLAQATGTGMAPDASGEVIYLPEQRLTVLRARSLPDLDEGMVYQVWFIADGAATSAGFLEITSAAEEAIAALPGNPIDFNGLAVTLEIAPGVPQPFGPIVLAADL